MNIILLIDAKSLGGVESHVMNLYQGLVDSNQRCKIIFIREYPDHVLYEICQERGIIYQSFSSYYRLFQALMKQKPDIIHTHGYKANIIGRLFGQMLKIKVVSSFHAGEKHIGRLILYNALDRWSSFLSYNICVNADIASKLPCQSQIIPNFIKIPEESIPLKKNGPYHIYYIGRFNAEKDPLKFCELSTLLPDDFKLHMVGSGPLYSECFETYKNSIQFHGLIKNMDALWNDIDLVCITSHYEGLPMILIEAMARGIPVVSFDVGSVKEIISDPDYVIESFDIHKMSFCIINHFQKSMALRKKISNSTRNKAIKTYSSSLVIPKIIHCYEQILSS